MENKKKNLKRRLGKRKKKLFNCRKSSYFFFPPEWVEHERNKETSYFVEKFNWEKKKSKYGNKQKQLNVKQLSSLSHKWTLTFSISKWTWIKSSNIFYNLKLHTHSHKGFFPESVKTVLKGTLELCNAELTLNNVRKSKWQRIITAILSLPCNLS